MHHILYHANCADGFAAACISRHALNQVDAPPSPHLLFHQVNYGWPQQLPPAFATGDTVTYLDYTPPQQTIDHLLSRNADLTIIDHHSTAAALHGRDKDTGEPTSDTPLRFTSIFNLKYSGAHLAWSHFLGGTPITRVADLIAWRDLGHAFNPQLADDPRTPHSLNLHAHIFRCIPRTPEAWTPLLLSDEGLNAAILGGSRLRSIDAALIAAAVNSPHWLDFHGEEIPAVNGLAAGLVSDACAALLRAYPTAPFAASWFIDPQTGHAVYSLRSRRDSTVNVAEIAAAAAPGGGGHPNAAGFKTPVPIPFV